MAHINCRHCGSSVTSEFARVFGDNDRTIHRCPDCTEMRRLFHGEGAGLSVPTDAID